MRARLRSMFCISRPLPSRHAKATSRYRLRLPMAWRRLFDVAAFSCSRKTAFDAMRARLINWTPTSASKSRICRLSDGCEVCSFCSAPTVRLPRHRPRRRSSADAAAPLQAPISRRHGASLQSLFQAHQPSLLGKVTARGTCPAGRAFPGFLTT
jgi:hypothetical protein